MEMMRPVWAEVNLTALKRNYQRLKTYTRSEMMPIVKADAYGHGVIPVVEALRDVGAKRFGVALLEEALEIKVKFPEVAVMVIGATPPEYSDIVVKEDIIPGIFQFEQALALSEAAVKQGKTARLHLKIDTGMSRIGFRESDLEEMLRVAALPNIYIEGIYTHFATADQADLKFAHKQLYVFQNIYEQLKKNGVVIPIRHAANSAGLLQFPEAHMELVRPGIILYGLAPSAYLQGRDAFEPVLSWKAKVSHIKTIEAGETVSYGRTFRAAYTTRVATVPVGYADGLRRILSNHGEMLLHGQRVTMIGRICMDQTMLDVTKIPTAQVGDTVTILGRDGADEISATEMGAWLKTINYEIVCGISKRVPRVYLE